MYRGFNLEINQSFFRDQVKAINNNLLVENYNSSQGGIDFYAYAGENSELNNKDKFGKSLIMKSLEDYIINGGRISGNKIEEAWFKSIDAQVFISHSHNDEKLAFALSGWLKDKFNIDAFVDSQVWGDSNELLKILDNKFCLNDNSAIATYDYKKRNITTSHVHLILNIALQKMIDQTDCLIFINTPQSVLSQTSNEISTFSPWIYSELEISRTIRRFKRRNPLNENKSFMEYKTNIEHLTKLYSHDLITWLNSYNTSKDPLDVLYNLFEI